MTVKQLVKAVKNAFSSGLFHSHEEFGRWTLVYYTKKFKEVIAFEYRNKNLLYHIRSTPHGTSPKTYWSRW